ncbi:MAG: class II fumarate hydratase [Methanobacteriota archaeon]|nr:MAG: class II fumarate hydratase [Euryarchaeota archaeon]
MEYRIEKDSMGEVKVPADKLWGAQTQRSLMNFDISSRKFPKPFIKALIEVKRAVAIANKELGQVDAKIADAIVQAAEEILEQGMHLDQFPLDIYQTGSGTQTNMNANEVLANRAIQILGGVVGSKDPVHPNDHVNKGQSSNDVIPTAMHISTLVEIEKRLLPELDNLSAALEQKAKEFMGIIKIGRTHLQDAVPLSLGQEFSGYVHQLKIAKQAINAAKELIRPLALGGTAVGTGLNAHPDMSKRAIEIISERTGVQFSDDANKFALLAGKDGLVAVSGALKTLAVALIKIANDIRLLASGPRCGIGELHLPENEPGSSIMPGKVNPTQAEMIVQVGAQVIGNDAAITAGGTWGFYELNLMKPMIISNVLESIDILTRGMASFRKNAVEGITANVERISSLVDKSLMLATALTPVIGYDKAAELAKKAYKEGKTIREVVREEQLMSEDELEKALDLTHMVFIRHDAKRTD